MISRADLSKRQRELKEKHRLTDKQFRDMLAMLDTLTAAERGGLADPDFITEDEADLIYSDRSVHGPGRNTSAEELFKETGHVPRRRA